MRLLPLILSVFFLIPLVEAKPKENKKKKYVAKAAGKYKKSHKKVRYRYIGAAHVNRAVSGDFLKLKDMLRDLNE